MSGPVWLTLAYRAPVRTVEPDGSVSEGWGDAVQILGHIQQRKRSDVTSNGREGLLGEYLLLTRAEVEGRGRVIDTTVYNRGCAEIVYGIVGFPAAVHDSKGVHHYEATLESVTG
jgi:hypothetical protein